MLTQLHSEPDGRLSNCVLYADALQPEYCIKKLSLECILSSMQLPPPSLPHNKNQFQNGHHGLLDRSDTETDRL